MQAALIYDGDCAMCSGCAAWVAARLSPADSVAIVSGRDWVGSASPVVLELAELSRAAWWIEGAQRFEGIDAISRALRRVSGPWSLVGRALETSLVAPVAKLVYRAIARHRHRKVPDLIQSGGSE